MDPTHKYSNATGEDAMSWRWRYTDNHKRIATDIKGLDLVVATDRKDYYAFLVKGNQPQGYVKFEHLSYVPSSWQDQVFTPHSYTREQYRGKGYITSVYQWFLRAGHALLAAESHTSAASALWKGLIAKYPHRYLLKIRDAEHPFVPVDKDDATINTTVLLAPSTRSLNKLLKDMDNVDN
jgi:hypothetical protein